MKCMANGKRSFRMFQPMSMAREMRAMHDPEADHIIPSTLWTDLKFSRTQRCDYPPSRLMASQAKDRHSAQLARSLTEFNQTIAQTKSLLEQFSTDLGAMRTLTAIHVSQCASLISLVRFQNEMRLLVDL